jgi:hypothetical protein
MRRTQALMLVLLLTAAILLVPGSANAAAPRGDQGPIAAFWSGFRGLIETLLDASASGAGPDADPNGAWSAPGGQTAGASCGADACTDAGPEADPNG